MGLSARERGGSRKLLKLLNTADLSALTATVTKKKSTAYAGAIDTILRNSQSASELLNHKKVIRDIIVAYLRNEGVPIPPKITKAEAVQKTLAHWSNRYSCIPRMATSRTPEPQKATASDFSHPFYIHTSISSIHSPQEDVSKTWKLGARTLDLSTVPHRTTGSMFQTERQTANFEAKNENVAAPPYIGTTSVPHVTTPSFLQTKQQPTNFEARTEKASATTYTGITTVPHMMLQTKRQPANFEAKNVLVAATPYTGVTEEEDTSCIWPVYSENFTVDFCKWFYSLLNSQRQSSGPQKTDWGPQHFLENAALQLTYMSTTSRHNGGRSVSLRLLALIQEDKLIFQPNINSRGVRCENSPQGMVVTVAGTVFRNKSYLGTFDQVFEVVGNSRINNWKIRYVDLKILKST